MTKSTRPTGVSSDIGPFAIVPMWLIEEGAGGNAIRLYAALAGWYADRATGKAHPSRSTLAKRIGVSTDTVDRALRELETLGAVEVEQRYEAERQTSNGYTIRFVRPGVGRSAEPPVGESAEPPVGRSAAQNENHYEPEPQEPERLPAAPEPYDPVKGIRVMVEGKDKPQDLPWNALEEATQAYGKANGKRMRDALQTIREEIWKIVQAHSPEMEANARRHPGAYEGWVAGTIQLVARALKRDSPTLTWGPEGIARNYARVVRDVIGVSPDGKTTEDIVNEVIGGGQ